MSPLTDIFGANTLLLPEIFHDLEDKEDLLKLPNTLLGDKTTDQLGSSHQSRIKSGVIKYVDHRNPKRLGKAMLVFQSHNVFHAKRIPQSNTHMI